MVQMLIMMVIATVAALLLMARPCFGLDDDNSLPFGFIDIAHDDYSAELPFHISRSVCSQTDNFLPGFVTAVTNDGTLPWDALWPDGNYTTFTRATEPTMMQVETIDSTSSVQIFIWPQGDPDPLNLDTCTPQDQKKLCKIDPNNRPTLFDGTLIFYANEFPLPNNTRLVVSRNSVQPRRIAADLASIGREFCGNETCLPYFSYLENRQRCVVLCEPIDYQQRRQGLRCSSKANANLMPKCELAVDGRLIFSSASTLFGAPSAINVTFNDFTPVRVTLRCNLPKPLAIRPCLLSNSGASCDPRVVVFRDGVEIYNSTDMPLQGAISENTPPFIDIFSPDYHSIEISLQFQTTMHMIDFADPEFMTGNYKFLLDFERVLVFDPHRAGIPEIYVRASSHMARDLAAATDLLDDNDFEDDKMKIGCRLTTAGKYDYRGRQNVDQCDPTQECLPWADNLPQDKFTSTFPEYTDSRIAKNFCRNPKLSFANTSRPWCFTKHPNQDNLDVWAYCDIPLCDKSLEPPLGYVHSNGDCKCNGSLKSLDTSDVTICADRCNANADCAGFVVEDLITADGVTYGSCQLQTCTCSDPVSIICNPRVAKSYYRRVKSDLKPYQDGRTAILIQLHNVETAKVDSYRIRCFLFNRPDQNIATFKWEFYDQKSGAFIAAPDDSSSESKWVLDANFSRFSLDLLKPISPERFNNRLYRCVDSTTNSFEYHLVKTIGLPRCTIYFNQVFDRSLQFTDYGVNVEVYMINPNNAPDDNKMPLQWDLECEIDRVWAGRCQMGGALCVPVVIVYERNLQIGTSLWENKDFMFTIDFPEDATGKINDPFKFHLSIFFANFSSWPPLQNAIRPVYSLLFYYPQLGKSHNRELLQKITTKLDYTANDYNTMPSMPLLSTGWPDSKTYMGMNCAVHIDYDGFHEASESLRITLRPPSPFQIEFRCTTKSENHVIGTFCYKEKSTLCHPANFALKKDDRVIYVGNWQKPDDTTDGKRIDSNATFPVFRYYLANPSDRRTMVIRMSVNNYDPYNLFDAKKREQLIAGRYELGVYLGTDTITKRFLTTDLKLDVVISNPTGVSKNTGDCLPAEMTHGWSYTGTTSKGSCDNKDCLPWTNELLKEQLEKEKAKWLDIKGENVVMPYQFAATESNNFCRNVRPSPDDIIPQCVVGFDPIAKKLEWRECDIPLCEDSLFSNKHYVRQLGVCRCEVNETMSGIIEIDGQTEYHPSSNLTIPVVAHCRTKCDETPECVAFNFYQIPRTCQFLRCQCRPLRREPLEPNSCDPTPHNGIVHYYERVKTEEKALRTAFRLDTSPADAGAKKAELIIHHLEEGSKDVLIGCDLSELSDDGAEPPSFSWEVSRDGVNFTEVLLGDKLFAKLDDEVSFKTHDKVVFTCRNNDDISHFQSHLINVLILPNCSLSFKGQGDPTKSLITSRGYGVSFKEFWMEKEPIEEKYAGKVTLIFECYLNRSSQIGYCTDDKPDQPCAPYFKVFHKNNPIYRSYDDYFVEGDHGMTKPEFSFDTEIPEFTITMTFNPAKNYEKGAIAFYFVPHTVTHFDQTVYYDPTKANPIYGRAAQIQNRSRVVYLLVAIVGFLLRFC